MFMHEAPKAFAPVLGGWGRLGSTSVLLGSVTSAQLQRQQTRSGVIPEKARVAHIGAQYRGIACQGVRREATPVTPSPPSSFLSPLATINWAASASALWSRSVSAVGTSLLNASRPRPARAEAKDSLSALCGLPGVGIPAALASGTPARPPRGTDRLSGSGYFPDRPLQIVAGLGLRSLRTCWNTVASMNVVISSRLI
jgi:hypothetical protein